MSYSKYEGSGPVFESSTEHTDEHERAILERKVVAGMARVMILRHMKRKSGIHSWPGYRTAPSRLPPVALH